MLTMLLLATIFLAVLGIGAQGIALGIAGVLAPIATHLMKGRASGGAAVVIAVAISAVIALVATYIAGDIHNLGDVVKNATAVFGLSQIVFHVFKPSDAPQPKLFS